VGDHQRILTVVCILFFFLTFLFNPTAFEHLDLRIIAVKLLISSQVIVGTIAFLGLIVSTLLVFIEAMSAKCKELKRENDAYVTTIYLSLSCILEERVYPKPSKR
jgi:membrane-bound ClpP family serine protease